MNPPLQPTAAPSRDASAARPLDLSCSQRRWLGRAIAGLRSGAVNDIVMHHLEVDGVLQLDPLIELAAAQGSVN